MNRKMLIRLVNDFAMTVLMLIGMAYYITGNTVHEVIGVVVLILFIVHNFFNRHWYKVILRGKLTVRRFLQIGINLSFLVSMFLMMASAVLISSELFPFIPIDNDMTLRQIHVQSAYWGFILMAVHVGLSWEIIINSARRMTGISGKSRIRTILLRVLAVVIVSYGVNSSFEREVGSKLLIYNPFGWYINADSYIRFLIDHLAIMGIYICGTHYALKFIRRHEERRVLEKNVT